MLLRGSFFLAGCFLRQWKVGERHVICFFFFGIALKKQFILPLQTQSKVFKVPALFFHACSPKPLSLWVKFCPEISLGDMHSWDTVWFGTIRTKNSSIEWGWRSFSCPAKVLGYFSPFWNYINNQDFLNLSKLIILPPPPPFYLVGPTEPVLSFKMFALNLDLFLIVLHMY